MITLLPFFIPPINKVFVIVMNLRADEVFSPYLRDGGGEELGAVKCPAIQASFCRQLANIDRTVRG